MRLKRPLAHRAATAALEAAWRSKLLPEPPLDAEALIEGSIRRTGLDDFGPDWRPPFDALLRSLREEANLNALGRTMASGQVSQILRDRLRAQALWRKHPEILDRPLAPPVVILGHMRSGTTRLQRLLACDPRFATTRFYEVFRPVPPGGLDIRKHQAALVLAALHAFNPALKAIHPTAADAPDEQYGLLAHAFCGAQFEAQWRVPGFTRFWEGRDRRAAYARFCRLLQTIGWRRGDDPARPWLLKAPQFMEDLEPLLAAFPGAKLLYLHRDPVEVVASSASLVYNQMLIQSDETDPAWVGREWLEKTARRERRAAAALDRHAGIPRLDIDYDSVSGDWRGQMTRLYNFLDLPLTPNLKARMADYLRRAEGQGFHRHDYALEDFGLGENAVRSRFASPTTDEPAPQRFANHSLA